MKNPLGDLVKHRELLVQLSVKDFKVRYKNALLGFLWVILNPILLAVVLTIVFSKFARIQVTHYPLFVLSALVPWGFMSLSVSAATTSVLDNNNLIKKVHFPREILPVSVVMAHLLHFLPSLGIVLLFSFLYNSPVTPALLLLPMIILIQVSFVTGLSLLTSSLYVLYRDVRYLVDAVLTLWFYATPIIYPVSIVPEKLLTYYMLNPMTGLVEAYRELILNGRIPDIRLALFIASVSAVMLAIGALVFNRYKDSFADLT